jgi:hypothetical protein
MLETNLHHTNKFTARKSKNLTCCFFERKTFPTKLYVEESRTKSSSSIRFHEFFFSIFQIIKHNCCYVATSYLFWTCIFSNQTEHIRRLKVLVFWVIIKTKVLPHWIHWMYISMRLIKICSKVPQRKLLKFKPSSFQKNWSERFGIVTTCKHFRFVKYFFH